VSKRVAIIGGGIVGLATAYKILLRHPGTKLQLFEKEPGVGVHQSGRNSGVLHCGLYYQPGSLKARLAVDGIREMTKFCQEHGIEHEICGKIVVATTQQQVPTLRELASRGEKNGLKGLRFLSATETAAREPYVRSLETLLVPEEGIVNYKGVMSKLVELIRERGGEVHFTQPIESIESRPDGTVIVQSDKKGKCFDRIVNCTGLHSDRTYSSYTGKKRPLRIVPFRGEYLMLKPHANHLVNHLVYPTPDIKFPFLGVHFTRLIHGAREVGPNAVFAFKREGYTNRDFSLKDSWDSLSYGGFHRFVLKNFSFAIGEFTSSLFMSRFIKKAKALIPEVDSSMLEKGTAGVRAQAMSDDGKLIMDFRIEREGNQIHVLNAPSPGATASLAIAEHVLENYLKDLN
jgi:L-2-hydroxyglutarate oxidase